MNSVNISIVVPVYGCRTALVELYLRLKTTLTQITDDFEIILINDASPDGAWETIQELAAKDSRILGVDFSRNFGQHYAITAGLEHAKGEWIVVMDCDLQDRPEEILALYNKAQEGFDAVLARRAVRNDTFVKKTFSQLFYKLFGYLTDTKYDNTVANFGIYNHKVIKAVLSMNDKIRVFPVMLQWVGFNKCSIDVVHDSRVMGKSSYNFTKLFNLAFNIIISFSNKPLLLTVRLGIFISLISLGVGIFYTYKHLTGQILVSGFAGLIVSIWFLSGMIIFSIGILGIYLGKLFDTSKDRPNYIIKSIIKHENE